MARTTTEIADGLGSVLGDSRITTDPVVCDEFAVDGVVPRAVVYPESAEEVAAVLSAAAEHDLAVISQRNATKLNIGSPPLRYDVALSLKDMNRVWYYEPDDLVLSVEPGMKFGDLQHFLARHKLWIPLDPAGGGRASVGGILASNAAGPLRLRYGGPRDMVLGMKIAMPDGQIVNTGGRVVKNVAGYDLVKVLIGSYGTLGVIVEATFKLYPQVPNRATWVIAPGSLSKAREIRREVLASPLTPLRMVLLNGRARRLLNQTAADASSQTSSTSESSLAIWVEVGGSDRVIARYSNELGALAAKHRASFHAVESEVATPVWERIADFGLLLTRDHHVPVVVRTALPIASCEEFLEWAEKAAQTQVDFEVAGLVQLGAGVVELGLASSKPASPTAVRPPIVGFIERLRHTAISLGGGLVVTRCSTEVKSMIDVWGPAGDDFEIIEKLKAAWDPKGTLAPGRFIGGI